MVVYTSLTGLAHVVDSIVALSSSFFFYLCFHDSSRDTREFSGHDVLVYVLPSLGSCYAIIRTRHIVAQTILGQPNF